MHVASRLERTFGEAVRRLRKRRGWTLAELAAVMSAAGRPTDKGRLSRIERGQLRSPVSFRDLDAVASALELPPAAFITEGGR